MAVCTYCNREMIAHVGCGAPTYTDFADGIERARIPYPADATRDCHDCACPPGTLHHPGCDAERCPRCGEQAIACDCTLADEVEDALWDAGL